MARLEYRALVPGQPLILQREPTNRVDKNAIIVLTVLLQPCGYIAKEHAAVVAPQLDRRILWLAKVTKTGSAFKYPQVVLWRDRGSSLRFRALCIEHGASPVVADRIIGKAFLPGN